MSIRISCPGCGMIMNLSEDKRGKRITCQGCQKTLSIPGPARPARESSDAIQEERLVRTRTAPEHREEDRRESDRNERSTALRPAKDRYDRQEKSVPRPSRRKGRSKDSGPSLGLILGLAGGGAALIGVVILVLVLSSSSDSAPAPAPAPVGQIPPVNVNLNPVVPEQMAAEVIQRVKKSTVYLRVTTPAGQIAEGSGFLALDPGLVVTNAHVLGMLGATGRAPSKVDVVLNSGEPNEFKAPAKILGVDRLSDLALLRVEGKQLPPPLQIETRHKLIETQKIYIFGFPFGERLGKNITVSESTVSSLRKGPGGSIQQIQCNGGMHPGNSGGPVVNASGNLVGVSVAGIPGTLINFAIPAEFVYFMVDGCLIEENRGEPFVHSDGKARVPVQLTFLDPLRRIRDVEIHVWTGDPVLDPPEAIGDLRAGRGEGSRQTFPVKYKDGVASAEVPLPTPPAGKVVWMQTSFNSVRGRASGPPRSLGNDPPLERKSANLTFQLASQKERTLRLQSSLGDTFLSGNTKDSFATKADVEMVEVFSPEKRGAVVKTGFAMPKLSIDDNGRTRNVDAEVVRLLMAIPPVFVIDGNNQLRERADVSLNASVPEVRRLDVADFYAQIVNAYEASNIIMPNRILQPKESWKAKVPLLLKAGKKTEIVDLVLICTYEGTRQRNGRDEAFVAIDGRVEGRNNKKILVDGKVTGKLTFDLAGGYIAQVKLGMASEIEIPGARIVDSFDVVADRSPGNPKKIQVPERRGNPTPTPAPVAGQVILTAMTALGPNDPANPFRAGTQMRVIPVQMQAGKTYVIQLDSDVFDPYLFLTDAAGKYITEDDDSGGGPNGLNARIVFQPAVTATYRILVGSFDERTGPFKLTVTKTQ